MDAALTGSSSQLVGGFAVGMLYAVIGVLSAIGSIVVFRRISRKVGTDFLVLVPCRDCRLLPELGCLFRRPGQGLANGIGLRCPYSCLCCVWAVLPTRHAFGFAMHGLWDIAIVCSALHSSACRRQKFPWLRYACLTFDLTVAGYLMMSDTAWDEPGKFHLYFWRNRA